MTDAPSHSDVVARIDALRSASRDGAGRVDDLVEFARDTRWRRRLLAFATEYAERAERDGREFKARDDLLEG